MRTLLLPAYEAWVDGDPQTALVGIDGVLQMFEGLGISNPRVRSLGNLYSALGKGQLARQWLTNGLDRENQHYTLAILASEEGDDEGMKDHLRQYLKSPTNPGGSGIVLSALLAQAGFLAESEKMLTQLEERFGSAPSSQSLKALIQMVRGVLELRKGNTGESIRLLEDAFVGSNLPYISSQFLAEAWSQEGELQKAVQVLEEASKKKYLVLAYETPIRWLRIRAALAKLYRETGRDKDAREIEEDLRRHLAYADPDHPILRQLDRTKELALLEATNN